MITLRSAHTADVSIIWNIFQQAILKRKHEGSTQWQNGYPNEAVIIADIEKGYGYVAVIEETILGYIAIIFDGEPAYDAINGAWKSNVPFAVLHRLAVKQDTAIKGLGSAIMLAVEPIVKTNNINAIRVDTNYDNIPMLNVFKKLGYQYCGVVTLPGGAREAFEKIVDEVKMQ